MVKAIEKSPGNISMMRLLAAVGACAGILTVFAGVVMGFLGLGAAEECMITGSGMFVSSGVTKAIQSFAERGSHEKEMDNRGI